MYYLDYDANERAALLAEQEGQYRSAYDYWCKLVTHAQNNPKFKEPSRLVGWIEHKDYCNSMK